ncbi:MAG: tetratricopeptide repeat protein [candidate division WOR-3 bacterium]|nr:tetratricopeptide repeat protein [candidate division WOR-3 bacterium]
MINYLRVIDDYTKVYRVRKFSELSSLVVLFLLSGSTLWAGKIDIAHEYFIKGSEYYTAREYVKAIEQYHLAVKLEPASGLYRLSLASAYGKNRQYSEAIPHLKKAIFFDTTLTDAYYLIEDFYSRLNKEDSAIAYFNEQRIQYPHRAVIYINLGHLYYRKKDFNKAIEEFSKAQTIEPNNPVIQCGLGVVMLAQGNDSTAEIFFLNAIKLDSLYPEAHLYYSLVLERKGMMKEAERERNLAYQLKPELKEVDLSGVLPIRGEKADIPFIVSTLDIIVQKLVRPEERLAELVRKPFDLNLGTGLTTINKERWLTIKSQPAMETKWFGFNLALDMLVNQDGIRSKEWDYRKVFQKVRVGHPNLPFYVGTGVISNYTLGYGLIVRDYFNQADENNRKMGGQFTFQTKDNAMGITGMVNNLSPIEVTIGRAFLGKWAQEPEELLQRLEFGFTYAQDNEYDYKVLGCDMLFYLTSSGAFHFLVASELAKTLKYGFGNVSGLFLQFGGMRKTDFSLSLYGAGLILGKDFEPAPFDAFYEKERRKYGADIIKVSLKRYDRNATGFYGVGSLNLGIVLKITADYQNVSGVDSSGLFAARIIVADDENIPIILRGVFYKYNFDNFSNLTTMDENTYIAGIAGLKFFKGLFSINLLYERTYVWQEETENYEIQEKFSPHILFNKSF